MDETGENSATFKMEAAHVFAEQSKCSPRRACGGADVAAVCLQALSAALGARKASVRGLCCTRSTEPPFSSAAQNPGEREQIQSFQRKL